MMRTGSPECCTTLSVTLPKTQRLTPERPWVHIAIKLSGGGRPKDGWLYLVRERI
jgi:hypothetical protein